VCSPKEVPHVQHGTLCAGRKEIQHKKYKNKITIKGNFIIWTACNIPNKITGNST